METIDRLVLNAMPGGIVLVDDDLRFVYVNPAGEAMLASSDGYLRGRPLVDIVPGDAHVVALIGEVAEQGHSISDYGIPFSTRRGETHLVDIHVSPVGDPPSHVLAVLHPCSVARQLDQQLANRSAARSVSQLAAMLAHEVKNPLSGIRGAAQLLEPALEAEDRVLVQLICDETDRVVALVDRMEQFTEARPVTPEPVNVHRVLEHVRRLAESGFGRHLHIVERYDPSLPPVAGDRDRLVQVFLNLVKNACEAAPQTGGEVRLVTHYRHGLRIGHKNSRERLELPITIEVWDNGPGVPEDLASQLFDPFVTGKAKGTGLGLSLVAKIVNDHGGVVGFQNHPQGTVFRVSLPAHVDSGGR
ncbi:MAG: two-component system sensor histidine kinase NtrB [Pseudomonadota bacterium]